MHTIAASLAVLLIATLATAAADTQFASINALLCIRTQFQETYPSVKSKLDCSLLCYRRRRCQAFSMADGWCQLFVFDACSKNVRDCNCTRRAQVFVRQQPGLPPGALCPAGYADDSCGTKYKFYVGMINWDIVRAAVDAESGLVIMADVIDGAELNYLKSLFSKYSMSVVHLGGRQLVGSPEPAGGWMWVSCNTSVSNNLWNSGEPNNSGGTESVVIGGTSYAALIDGGIASPAMSGGLGECLSPFD